MLLVDLGPISLLIHIYHVNLQMLSFHTIFALVQMLSDALINCSFLANALQSDTLPATNLPQKETGALQRVDCLALPPVYTKMDAPL